MCFVLQWIEIFIMWDDENKHVNWFLQKLLALKKMHPVLQTIKYIWSLKQAAASKAKL